MSQPRENDGDDIPLEVIEGLPIFAGMDDHERQQLVDIATTMRFEPGDVVLRQGKDSQSLMVILAGRCQVVKHTSSTPACEIVLAELSAHDHFGEMSFFDVAPHSANVHALTEVKLMRIRRDDFNFLIEENSLAAYKLAYNVVRELATRIRRMDDWVSGLICQHSEEKQQSEWSSFRNKMLGRWNL